MLLSYILEVCVDSVESAIAAKEGGADRLEICSNLIIGGTSPSLPLLKLVMDKVDIPANILLRPRFGDFCYSDYEFEIIRDEVELFRKAGANGVVIGILKPDGNLDMNRMKVLIEMAGDMEVTLHRCFDVSVDANKTFEDAIELGIDTILTSGQKSRAEDAIELLDSLQNKSGKITIMAGSGINLEAVKKIAGNTAIKSYHMSGKKVLDSRMNYRKEGVPMGLPMMSEYDIWQTDKDEIAQVREYLDNLESRGQGNV